MVYKFIVVINPKDRKCLEVALSGKEAQIVSEEIPFNNLLHLTIEMNNLDDIFYLGEDFSYNKLMTLL